MGLFRKRENIFETEMRLLTEAHNRKMLQMQVAYDALYELEKREITDILGETDFEGGTIGATARGLRQALESADAEYVSIESGSGLLNASASWPKAFEESSDESEEWDDESIQ